MDPEKYLEELLLKGLEECSPSRAVADAVDVDGERLAIADEEFDIRNRPVFLLGMGKASVPMFEAARNILTERVSGSLVITSDEESAKKCSADEVIASGHPTPDNNSKRAGKKVVDFLQKLTEDALVITLISGGTSSLVCLPAEGISLDDLNNTFRLLNNSGATIDEINMVRKHCSQIKGGQLLRYLKAGTVVVDLVISDVPGDDLSIIGSGPTTPDPATFSDACDVLQQYELWEKVPAAVREHIENGKKGEAAETVKPDEEIPVRHSAHIIGSARKLGLTISDLVFRRNHNSWMMDEAFNESVDEVAQQVADRVVPFARRLTPDADTAPSVFVFYGESTVSVTGEGKGGRNQELALRGALRIDGYKNITWLSAGTDGIDGPTDAAGAIVNGGTIASAKKRGINPQQYLDDNDSYHFHERMGTLLKTGATGNNVMDIVLVLVEGNW